jgi:hypothetical protein
MCVCVCVGKCVPKSPSLSKDTLVLLLYVGPAHTHLLDMHSSLLLLLDYDHLLYS